MSWPMQMRSSSILSFTVLHVVAACSGGGTSQSSLGAARADYDDSVDAGAAGSGSSGVACDYTEQYDATNDYDGSDYALEVTGLVFAGAPQTICGVVNNGHFDDYYYSIDIDNYGIALGSNADVLVTLANAGGDLGEVEQLGVWVYDPVAGASVGGGYYLGTHGAASMHLPAGNYELSVEAYADGDIAAPVPYVVTIAPDAPATRCPAATGAPDYTEANDGSDSTLNDMIAIDYTQWPYESLDDSPAEAPEPTGLVIQPAIAYHLSGVSAAAAQTGSYFDRDTYLVASGSANQLAVRLDWPGSLVDLDYYLTFAGSSYPLAQSAHAQLGGEEFATFAVEPNTSYWLWVGAYQSSTPPTGYDVTVCGESD